MKTKHLLLIILIAGFSSCSVAYRTGQTPDDVYYSPAPPQQEEYVATTTEEDRDSYAYNNNTYNDEDLQIRRGIKDPRYRTNVYLDFGFGYNPYDYYSYYNPYSYNPYSIYNPYAYKGIYDYGYPYNYNYYGFYSPFSSYYYPPLYYSISSGPVANYPVGARRYNLGAYGNTTNNNNRVTFTPTQPTTNNTVPVRTFTKPSQNRSGVGNFIRRVFTPTNNTSRSSNTRSFSNNDYNNNSSSTRTTQVNNSSNNSSSSSSSSSSGSSGSAPVRSFRK